MKTPTLPRSTAWAWTARQRGRGLGRALLRYACAFAAGRGLDPVVLSVNAENDTALGLYQAEGFAVAEAVVCYALDCAG